MPVFTKKAKCQLSESEVFCSADGEYFSGKDMDVNGKTEINKSAFNGYILTVEPNRGYDKLSVSEHKDKITVKNKKD